MVRDAAPTVLAIDTAAAACSVAIRRGVRNLAAEQVAMARGHAEALLPMVGRVLAAAATDRRDVDLIAVTVGPGAFTGLRVGLAAARGLALAARLPAIGVSTLAALAEAVVPAETGDAADVTRLAVLDTKRGDVYAQAFTAAGIALAAPAAVAIADLPGLLPTDAVVVAGDVAEPVAAALATQGFAVTVAPGTGLIDPDRVAALALRRWHAGDRPSGPPVPVYIRAPEARPAVAGGRRRP